MASRSLLLFSLFCVIIQTDAEPLVRRKRSLLQLEQVMQCATQLPGGPFNVFSTYNCYGCYCGKGGAGEPVDAIDQCCQVHDQCYDKLTDSKTCRFWLGQVYVNSYEFECKEGDVDLPTATGNTTRLTPQCTKADTACGKGACDCDVAFANCIRQFKIGEKKSCPKKRTGCFAGNWFGSSEEERKLA